MQRCWKHFWMPLCENLSSSSITLLMLSVSQKCHPFNADFKGRHKNLMDPGQEGVADAPVLSHCSLLRNPWSKLIGVLEHHREGETKYWLWLDPGQEGVADAPVLSYCSLLTNPWPKLTGVLEHRREGETKYWLSIFWGVSYWLHAKGDKPTYETEISLIQQFL